MTAKPQKFAAIGPHKAAALFHLAIALVNTAHEPSLRTLTCHPISDRLTGETGWRMEIMAHPRGAKVVDA